MNSKYRMDTSNGVIKEIQNRIKSAIYPLIIKTVSKNVVSFRYWTKIALPMVKRNVDSACDVPDFTAILSEVGYGFLCKCEEI